MATKRENSNALNGNTAKRVRASRDEIQNSQQDENEKTKRKVRNFAVINELGNNSACNNNKNENQEQKHILEPGPQDEPKQILQNYKTLNNENDSTSSSCDESNSIQESNWNDSKDFNITDDTNSSQAINNIIPSIQNDTTFQEKTIISKNNANDSEHLSITNTDNNISSCDESNSIQESNSNDSKDFNITDDTNSSQAINNIIPSIQNDTTFQEKTIISKNNANDSEHLSSTNTDNNIKNKVYTKPSNSHATNMSTDNVIQENTIKSLEHELIKQLRQQKYWYPSKFESGIYALKKYFNTDEDIESCDEIDDDETNQISIQRNLNIDNNQTTDESNIHDENRSDINLNADHKNAFQDNSEQNLDHTIVEENVTNSIQNNTTLENITPNEVRNSGNVEIFDDRSNDINTLDTNIERIMNNSEIWPDNSVSFPTISRSSPRFECFLEGVNNILNNNTDYVGEEYEVESSTDDSSEESSDDCEDNDGSDFQNQIELLSKPDPQVVEIFRVDVKTKISTDELVCYEKLKVERSYHSIKNAAQMRRLQNILQLNSIPRPLEQGADKFNMVLGGIPDVINVLKAYPDSSHYAHVRLINPEQENYKSLIGDIYIGNNPKKMIGDCPICMYTFGDDPVSTLCGHVFCENCLEHAIQYHKQCPSCRKQLRTPYYHKIYL